MPGGTRANTDHLSDAVHLDAAAVVAELKARNLPAARIGQVTGGNAGHVRVRQ